MTKPEKLTAIAGPLSGSIIDLSGDRFTMGRHQSNQICLKSTGASRKHCLIEREGGRLKIVDLDSSNGTFVNDVPVQQRWLEHGDRIRVADSLFLLSFGEGAPPVASTPRVELSEHGISTKTVELTLDVPMRIATEVPTSPSEARLVSDLRVLVDISGVVNSIREVAHLEQELLTAIFKVIPAERGAILLLEKDGESIASVFGADRVEGFASPVEVSRTIMKQVFDRGVAVLCNDVLATDGLAGAESLQLGDVRSVLAVPLVAFEKNLGLIYLYSSQQTARFDENHLRLVTAICGIAAIALENARHMDWLGAEKQRLLDDMSIEHNLIGESPPMRKVHKFIGKVAPTEATVLILGESGTGKELVARAIHRNSPRASGPFVAINCAALSENLLESELFGHEKGSFTGATAQKKGKLEVAEGGTLFLDEIGELAPNLQAKMLRVLQEHEFERVGGVRPITADVRVVTATNKDLKRAAVDGDFREDLYYRINVVSLEMPPLRERRDDIPLLSSYFVEKYAAKCKQRIEGISPRARECLMSHSWPGNVRELENAIERAVVLGSTDVVRPEDLPEVVLESDPPSDGSIARYHEAILGAKKQLIVDAFERANGNHLEAATLLGLHPNYLHRLLRNFKLRDRTGK